ncbi:hypothetical protein [Streptomyces sp. NPDC058374]|uniref:hypothetical protein n=1 Tax=unclassified Streptomyces TaxID=2593676 RepID=UPI003652AE86
MNAPDPAGRDGAPGPGGPDELTSRSLRRALRSTADELTPPPYPAALVRGMGRRRERNRRVAAAVPAAAAAVLVMVAVPQWLGSGASGGPSAADPAPSAASDEAGRPSSSAAPAQPPQPSVRPWPSVRTAEAGEPVEIGRGHRLTLAQDQVCHRDTGEPEGGIDTCKSVSDGNQPTGTVSLQQYGELVRPLYVGPGRPARMTVETGGEVYRARVLTLEGSPGYAVGYAWADRQDRSDSFDDPPPVVRVYDDDGEVLAEFP